MSILVLPVYFVGRIPFVVRFIKCEAEVVRTVSFVFKSTGSFAVIVNDIDSDNVSVAESFIVRSCSILLIDGTGNYDRLLS